jgi:hypothetical protein
MESTLKPIVKMLALISTNYDVLTKRLAFAVFAVVVVINTFRGYDATHDGAKRSSRSFGVIIPKPGVRGGG